MPDEVNFMDLASILKITPNTPLEKLGSALNASIFDASNVAGSLKQKGLIEFTAYYPGPNAITVTEAGKALITEADAKSADPFDKLDESILAQLSGGKRIIIDLQNTLNLRPKDLALRVYKMSKQGFLIYELKNGGVELMLTEKGFLKASGGGEDTAATGMQAERQAQQQGTQQPVQMPMQQAVTQNPVPDPTTVSMPDQQTQTLKKPNKMRIVVPVIVIVAVLAVLHYKGVL